MITNPGKEEENTIFVCLFCIDVPFDKSVRIADKIHLRARPDPNVQPAPHYVDVSLLLFIWECTFDVRQPTNQLGV